MSSHTIVCLAGKRMQVKPSPTSPGMVLVQILSADRAVQASVTVDAAAAGVLSLAFELEGREAERVHFAAMADNYQAAKAAGVPEHLIVLSTAIFKAETAGAA